MKMMRAITAPIGLFEKKCRLLGHALSLTEERQAVDLYSWPIPLQIAGYATVISALASILFTTSILHASWPTASAVAVLWVCFVAAFYLIASHPRLPFPYQLLLFLSQVAGALVLLHIAFCSGTEVLFYMLAAEIQFLIPFRAALAVTFALWPVMAIDAVLSAPAGFPNFVQDVWLVTPTGFVFVAAFTRTAVTELVQRRRSTLLLAQLNDAHRQLQEYADRVEELAVARERNRMAREIHDTIGHYLTVINVQLESAQKLSSRDLARSQEALASAKQMATECLKEVRRSVSALRPAVLENVPLAEALDQLVEELRHSTDAAIHLEVEGEGTLQPAVEVVAYRAIQEGLTNVRKHARARNVWVRMEWKCGSFSASVRDDGRGAPSADLDGHPASIGLRGMRERLARVDGTLDIETAPGAGFCLSFHIPSQEELLRSRTLVEEAASA